jgi:hypothetical protein
MDAALKRFQMTAKALTIPEIGLMLGTRVALGVGIGLLLSDRLRDDQRKGAGWALLGIGVLTTAPIIMNIIGKPPVSKESLSLVA